MAAKYYASLDGASFNIGPAGTREAVLAQAQAAAGGPEREIWTQRISAWEPDLDIRTRIGELMAEAEEEAPGCNWLHEVGEAALVGLDTAIEDVFRDWLSHASEPYEVEIAEEPQFHPPRKLETGNVYLFKVTDFTPPLAGRRDPGDDGDFFIQDGHGNRVIYTSEQVEWFRPLLVAALPDTSDGP